MADGDVVTAATEPPGDPIVRVGRYVLGRALGASPRGDRHAAIDPRDDRRVAIARLHHDLTAADAAALRALAHPNIVPILDAGSAGGRGYVVTAADAGAPIDRWARGHRAARIVAAFRAAGRGLAAAHAAGVIHGDVTATDVVVDGDGIARITGFVAAAPPDAAAAADQRAFAAALDDALAAAGVAAVPRRVRAALDRARARDPAARFPSLAAFVDALAPSRRGVVVAAGVVAVAAVTAAIAIAIASPDDPAPAPVVAAPAPGPPRAVDADAAYPLTTEPGSCASAPVVLDDTVYYDRTDGGDVNVYSVALPDGEPRAITRGARWSWRPNRGASRRELVYLQSDPTSGQLPALMLLSTTGATASTTMLRDTVPPSIHDAVGFAGTTLYVAADGIHQLDILGDHLLRPTSAAQPIQSLAMSSDERWLATTAVRADGTAIACAIDMHTARSSCIDHEAIKGRPAFGRADALYFSGSDAVWWHDQDTGQTALVERGLPAPGGIAVTDDGRALVLSRCEARHRIVEAGTWPRTVVVEDGFAPALASDGTLVYLAERGNAARVSVRFPDGHAVELDAPDASAGEAPAISPDGKRVAYTAAALNPGIVIAPVGVSAERGEARRRSDSDDRAPRWVDDDRVVFTRVAGGTARLYLLPAVGDPVLVADHAAGVAVRRGEVLVVRGGVTAWHDLATGRERPSGIAVAIADAAVSPSGRWLAYEDDAQRVWRVDLDAGTPPAQIIAVPPTRLVAHFAIGNDGRVLIAPIVWTGDLVVVPAAAGSRF